jgi:hypothetical protein
MLLVREGTEQIKSKEKLMHLPHDLINRLLNFLLVFCLAQIRTLKEKKISRGSPLAILETHGKKQR